jgi:2-phosphoglycerate kinase
LTSHESQAVIYLIGGPPRVGKTIISSEIRQRYAISVVSTDTLGAVLEKVLSPQAVPDLFVFDRFNQMTAAERVKILMADPAELIGYVRKESGVVWGAVDAFVRKEHADGREALVEGAAVLPELVSQLEDIPYRVVFIGNQAENHQENMYRSALENERDWMRDASDRYMRAFAMFVKQMSAYIERQAKKYGFQYIEMGKARFGDVMEDVIHSLRLLERL